MRIVFAFLVTCNNALELLEPAPPPSNAPAEQQARDCLNGTDPNNKKCFEIHCNLYRDDYRCH